jgi:hypothetical protein
LEVPVDALDVVLDLFESPNFIAVCVGHGPFGSTVLTFRDGQEGYRVRDSDQDRCCEFLATLEVMDPFSDSNAINVPGEQRYTPRARDFTSGPCGTCQSIGHRCPSCGKYSTSAAHCADCGLSMGCAGCEVAPFEHDLDRP